MRKLLALLLLSLFIPSMLWAQLAPTCGQEEHRLFMESLKNEKQNAVTHRHSDAIMGTVTIPVVVHVLYNTSIQNISESLIYSQINVLNEDFMMSNTDTALIRSVFKDQMGNPDINFCLARIDPDGNPTNGITRTSTNRTSFITFSNDMMLTNAGGHDPWPTDKYLNIWVCRLVNGAGQSQTGFAVFPWNATPTYDGAVVNYTNFGSPSNDQFYSDGRIATHEIGHFFGLSHNFKGFCGGGWPFNCFIAGDSICDTPPQQAFIQACQPGMSSCHGQTEDTLAMYENFMDYGITGCRLMFTKDQSYKMRTNIDKYAFRTSLTTQNTCYPLGVPETSQDQQITLFPNPTNDILYIESHHNQPVKVSLLTVNGTICFTKEINGLGGQINVANLPAGLYIVRFENNSGELIFKRFTKN